MNAVLVVDDEDLVRKALVRVLAAGGFACETASSMHEAAVAFDHYSPDVVLLNASLGDGSGLDLHRRIRATDRRRPAVVFVTARRDLFSQMAAQLGPADDWVGKPWDSAELVARVRLAASRACAAM